jgi:hypothetical protein
MGLSRYEMWARLGRIQVGTSLFEEASAYAEEKSWRNRLRDAPHGESWHTSFHGSQFPAGVQRWCPRLLAYGLMGVPEAEPISEMLRSTMVAGQAVEDWRIHDLDIDGRLLSANLQAKHQTGFTDNDHWLTGAPDFVVLPPGWNRPHLIETKTKDQEVLDAMKLLQRSYDAPHRRQLGAYIGLGKRITPMLWPKAVVCEHTWRLAVSSDLEQTCRDHGGYECLIEIDLEPAQTGSLIYMGRNRSNVKVEYIFEHDEQWFQDGLAKLDQVRESFLQGELPAHPFGGKEWSQNPCKFCDVKKHTCKPDQQAGVTRLEDSHGVGWAREVYGEYDFNIVTDAVLDRWRGKSGYTFKQPKKNDGRGLKAGV